MTYKISPFVKWVGGKRQLMDSISARMPKDYNAYYEPFVGGGAVFMHFQPNKVFINDLNRALINTYQQIRDQHEEVLSKVKDLDDTLKANGKPAYYHVREQYNDKIMRKDFDVALAAMFIFLNKHCFNGLYRVNRHGLFNVPYNNSLRPSCDVENIEALSRYLKNVTITCGDFEDSIVSAGTKDFVFIDSPYAPLVSTSFESYTKEGFDKESHLRLARLFQDLTKRGCYCMLTNHNTEFIRDLYKDFHQDVLAVKRMINRDANHRTGEEIIITNY